MLKLIIAAGLCLVTAAAGASDASTCPPFANPHPDMAKLRTLVCGTDVDAVERYLLERQRLYEASKLDGDSLLWAYHAFDRPYDESRITQWLKRYPRSHYRFHSESTRSGLTERQLPHRSEGRPGVFADQGRGLPVSG